MIKRIFTLICITLIGIQSIGWALPIKSDEPNTERIKDILPKNFSAEQLDDLILKRFLENNDLKTVEEYAQWLTANIKYEQDPEDEWIRPLETLKRGFGDCEDLAFLNAAILKHFGYEAKVLGIIEPNNDHVFCIFFKDGVFQVFDNTKLIITSVNSFEEIATFLHKKHDIDYLLEVRLEPTKSFRVIYTKAMLMQIALKR